MYVGVRQFKLFYDSKITYFIKLLISRRQLRNYSRIKLLNDYDPLQLINKVFKVFKKGSLHERLRYRNSMQNVQNTQCNIKILL